MAPVGPPRHRPWETDDEASAEQQPQTHTRYEQAGSGGSDRGAARSERRNRSVPGNQHDVQRDVEHGQRHAEPQRRAGVPGSAQRSAQHEEHQHADAEHEHRPKKRQGLGADLRCRMDEFEQIGRQQIAHRRHDAESQNNCCEERLINGAVDLVRLVRAGEARHQHAHPGEHELMNTMTTRKICQLTPMAALAV